MIWVLIAILAAPFVVYIAFFALCTAKKLLNSGIKLRWHIRLACYVALVAGWPADVIFNLVYGTIMFDWEIRGVTFSSRIQYYYEHPEKCPDRNEFEYWFKILETADPGHIT